MEMYRRGQVTAKRSQQAQFKDETRVILEAIASHLQNPDTCTRMLYNRPIIPGREAAIVLNYKYEAPTFRPGENTVEDGREITTGIVIQFIALHTSGPDLRTEIAEFPGVTLSRYRASLRTEIRSTDVSGLAPVNYRTDFLGSTDYGLPFYVWVDNANQIKSCFGIHSAGTACNMALGYYHVADPAGPALAQNLSCRQSVFMSGSLNPSPPGNLSNGACRYAGVRPSGTCPSGSFVNPPPRFSLPIQDASLGYPPMDACHQCE